MIISKSLLLVQPLIQKMTSMPNATCKMMASRRKTASYKNSRVIACPEHATADMHPFTPSLQKRKQVQDDPDL